MGRQDDDYVFNFNSLSVDDPSSSGPPSVIASHGPVTPPGLGMQGPPLVHYHAGVNFTPLPFHTLMGHNIRVSTDRRVAMRVPDEYCNAYVFTARPLCCGETVVLQVRTVLLIFNFLIFKIAEI